MPKYLVFYLLYSFCNLVIKKIVPLGHVTLKYTPPPPHTHTHTHTHPVRKPTYLGVFHSYGALHEYEGTLHEYGWCHFCIVENIISWDIEYVYC